MKSVLLAFTAILITGTAHAESIDYACRSEYNGENVEKISLNRDAGTMRFHFARRSHRVNFQFDAATSVYAGILETPKGGNERVIFEYSERDNTLLISGQDKDPKKIKFFFGYCEED